MPSLNPNRLRGVAWATEVDAVRPNPSWDQRTAVTPKPIRTRLRTACTATCGSSAQAWMHRSPPDSAGSIWSRVNRGSSARPAGLSAPRPSLSNSDAPTPKVSVSDGRGQPERLAGVGRRGVRVQVDRAARRRLGPRDHALGGRGPPAQHGPHLGRVVRGQIQRDEVQPVLGRGDDAGLVLAAERHHPGWRRLGGRAPGRVPGGRARPRPAPPRRRSSRAADAGTARRPGGAASLDRAAAGLAGASGVGGAATSLAWSVIAGLPRRSRRRPPG